MDQDIVFKVVEIVGAVVLGLIGLAAKHFAAKSKSEYVQNLIYRAENAAHTAVAHVEQSFVREVKKLSPDGRLSIKEGQEALSHAIQFSKNELGKSGLKELAKILGGQSAVDLFFKGKVESAIDLKK